MLIENNLLLFNSIGLNLPPKMDREINTVIERENLNSIFTEFNLLNS